MRRGIVIWALVAALLAAGVTGALARGGAGEAGGQPSATVAAKPKKQGRPARAAIVSTDRVKLLRSGRVTVRVRGRKGARVRIAAAIQRNGKVRRVSRTSRVRLKRGRKVVRLRLTRGGRAALRRCGPAALLPIGRARAAGAKRAAKLRRPRRKLKGALSCSARRIRPLGAVRTDNADRCDFLDPSLCLYPFPNDHFTRRDPTTPTGRRLDIKTQSAPRNRLGNPIAMTDQNRADGFSPGNLIVTKVPGLDNKAAFAKTGAVPITDMARSFDPDQPVVVINARTLKRQLIWAEVDANPANPADRTLIIRPGRNFLEGERYIVALRNMRDAAGKIIEPREEFRAYRDDLRSGDPDIEARRAEFEEIFGRLKDAGIERESLYLAWDFTVASRESLTGRALSIRDDAFAQLGDTNLSDLTEQGSSPQFVQNPNIDDDIADAVADLPLPDLPIPLPLDLNQLDGYREYQPCSAGTGPQCETGESDTTARRIVGTIPVPCYLSTPLCLPGGTFNLGPGGAPQRTAGNTAVANVICTVPRRAVDQVQDARPALYGHGLLGSAGEVGGGNVQAMGQEHNIVHCATDWAGMSTTDLPNVFLLLQDLSNFASLVDRIQQGYVNFMYLGRWMLHPQGASALPAFQAGGSSVIDRDELFYDGNSQGGILSGGLTALAPDFQRAVHGVPGMNYSTLLRRSVDFDLYANGEFGAASLPVGLYDSYPNELERPLLLSLIQLLWDRGEANGYTQHMTSDPLPDTPPHQVLLHPAYGDHQVATVTAEVEARSIGARAYRPALYPGRSPDVTPLYGIPTIESTPYAGSAIVYWDQGPIRPDGKGGIVGTPASPTDNVPPRAGKDPHSAPRSDPKARAQKSSFFNRAMINPCGFWKPCFAAPFTGP